MEPLIVVPQYEVSRHQDSVLCFGDALRTIGEAAGNMHEERRELDGGAGVGEYHSSTKPVTCFARDPVAPDSAQFPLARPVCAPNNIEPPSPEGVRPWGLRGMHVPSRTGTQLIDWRYDHRRQIAVDSAGIPVNDLRIGGPTADKVTSSDGDEGPMEDFIHDFAPDMPYPPP